MKISKNRIKNTLEILNKYHFKFKNIIKSV